MEPKEIIVKHLSDLPAAAELLLSEAGNEKVFAINGKMGAGKTTFIKALCKCLGVKEIVSSPTFALVNEYTCKKMESVFHFDFYRIKKAVEVFDIGYEEYFFGGDFCFIEWPELVVDLLPHNYMEVDIEVLENESRVIRYKPVTL